MAAIAIDDCDEENTRMIVMMAIKIAMVTSVIDATVVVARSTMMIVMMTMLMAPMVRMPRCKLKC